MGRAGRAAPLGGVVTPSGPQNPGQEGGRRVSAGPGPHEGAKGMPKVMEVGAEDGVHSGQCLSCRGREGSRATEHSGPCRSRPCPRKERAQGRVGVMRACVISRHSLSCSEFSDCTQCSRAASCEPSGCRGRCAQSGRSPGGVSLSEGQPEGQLSRELGRARREGTP